MIDMIDRENSDFQKRKTANMHEQPGTSSVFSVKNLYRRREELPEVQGDDKDMCIHDDTWSKISRHQATFTLSSYINASMICASVFPSLAPIVFQKLSIVTPSKAPFLKIFSACSSSFQRKNQSRGERERNVLLRVEIAVQVLEERKKRGGRKTRTAPSKPARKVHQTKKQKVQSKGAGVINTRGERIDSSDPQYSTGTNRTKRRTSPARQREGGSGEKAGGVWMGRGEMCIDEAKHSKT
eukprot:753651-Hanusia_phi.AAC.3